MLMENNNQRYIVMLEQVRILAARTNKKTVLIILQHTRLEDVEPRIPAIRESISNIIAFVAIGDENYVDNIVDEAKGVIDKIVVDTDLKRPNSMGIISQATEAAKRNDISISYYSDYNSWVDSSVNFVQTLQNDALHGSNVLILGKNALATRMIEALVARNVNVYVSDAEYSDIIMPYDCNTSITLCSPLFHIVNLNSIIDANFFAVLLGMSLMEPSSFLPSIDGFVFQTAYDIGIKNFTKDFIQRHRVKGTSFYRSDDRAGIASCAVSIMETDYLVNNNLGRVVLGSVGVVSGGIIGEEGDIVVDNAYNPTIVFGVANGDGTFKECLSEQDTVNINKIMKLL